MGDANPADEPADDLFGRWLAHRERSDDAQEPSPAGTVPAAVPTRASTATAAPPAPAVAATTFDLEPPSTFGAPRRAPVSRGSGGEADVPELDRVAPAGFEPVLLRSVRKKAEAKESEETKDAKKRFGLPRPRTTPLDDEVVEVHEAAAPADAPVEPAAAEVRAEPLPDLAPPTAALAVEDVIAAALAPRPTQDAHEPRPELTTPERVPTAPAPAPEPVPVPTSASEAWRSFVEPVEPLDLFDLAAPVEIDEREPVRPGTTAPEGDEQPTSRKARLLKRRTSTKAPKQGDVETPPRQPRHGTARREPRLASREWGGRGTREPDAVRTLIASAARQRVAVAPEPAPAPVVLVPDAEPGHPTADDAPTVVAAYAPLPPTASQMPATYEFAPLKSSRRILNALLLTGLTATGWLIYSYYVSGNEATKGITGIVALTTLLIWAARAGSSPAVLSVHHGQLEVRRQGSRFVFDLASTYTPIKVIGEPGRRGWKVLFLRRGMRAFAVDRSMVDPHEFMRVLRFFRHEDQLRGD
jgi:hypothetical protein